MNNSIKVILSILLAVGTYCWVSSYLGKPLYEDAFKQVTISGLEEIDSPTPGVEKFHIYHNPNLNSDHSKVSITLSSSEKDEYTTRGSLMVDSYRVDPSLDSNRHSTNSAISYIIGGAIFLLSIIWGWIIIVVELLFEVLSEVDF